VDWAENGARAKARAQAGLPASREHKEVANGLVGRCPHTDPPPAPSSFKEGGKQNYA